MNRIASGRGRPGTAMTIETTGFSSSAPVQEKDRFVASVGLAARTASAAS